jgi:hypothetical protein
LAYSSQAHEQMERINAAISMFYGIIVYMYFLDKKHHQKPHIHAHYQENEVVVSVPDGEVLEGDNPPQKMKRLQACFELHKDELVADWELAASGQQPYKIEPLR